MAFFLFKPFIAIAKGLKAVFNPKRVNGILRITEAVASQAFPIVELVALATPGRTDDELVAAAKGFGYGDFSLAMFGNKSDALRAIARFALSAKIRQELTADTSKFKDRIQGELKNFKEAVSPEVMALKESVLNAAIDQAYVVYKNAQQPTQ